MRWRLVGALDNRRIGEVQDFLSLSAGEASVLEDLRKQIPVLDRRSPRKLLPRSGETRATARPARRQDPRDGKNR